MSVDLEKPAPVVETHRPGHRVVRTGRIALRFNWRVLTMVAVALLALAVLGIWSMSLGAVPIPPIDVFLATIGQGDARSTLVVQEIRMPRLLIAILVGAALAMSGAIFQGLVRNELVSPDIIGINTGAAACGLVWLLVTRDETSLPLILFGGAMAFAMIIYGLSWKGGISPNRLILIGIGFQVLLTAFETFLVRRFPIEAIIWAENLLLGSVANPNWGDVQLLVFGMAVLVPAALFMSWPLRVLQMGDDAARAVGLPVELIRVLLMALGCWLSALAIAVAGLVGFIALMVPHAARMIAGPMSGSVMLLTGVLGSLLLLGGDVIGHHFLPIELPVSIVMGAVGAPYLLFLFWRKGARL